MIILKTRLVIYEAIITHFNSSELSSITANKFSLVVSSDSRTVGVMSLSSTRRESLGVLVEEMGSLSNRSEKKNL